MTLVGEPHAGQRGGDEAATVSRAAPQPLPEGRREARRGQERWIGRGGERADADADEDDRQQQRDTRRNAPSMIEKWRIRDLHPQAAKPDSASAMATGSRSAEAGLHRYSKGWRSRSLVSSSDPVCLPHRGIFAAVESPSGGPTRSHQHLAIPFKRPEQLRREQPHAGTSVKR